MTGCRFRNFCALVDVGSVNIDAMDENGRTPLILGCCIPNRSSGLSMVRKLIQSGASINKADATGKIIIHHAILQKHIPILKFLLDSRRVRLNAQDKDGNTALHLAVQAQDMKLIHLLVDHMSLYHVNSEYQNKAGLTPLTLACKLGRIDIARYLSKVGNQSPMNNDPLTRRDARMWLESVLFIPYELDPFNCDESELMKIQPRPLDYIPVDCKQNQINYKWHKVVCPKIAAGFIRPKSAPDRLMIASKSSSMSAIYRLPSRSSLRSSSGGSYYSVYSAEPDSFVTSFLTVGRESPASFLKRRSYSAHSRTFRHRSCKEVVPHLLALKATSEGIFPPAVPIPEEDKTPSELEAMEAEELMESLTHSRTSEALSGMLSARSNKKGEKKEKSAAKQKLERVHEVLTASSAVSKMKRKKSTNVMG